MQLPEAARKRYLRGTPVRTTEYDTSKAAFDRRYTYLVETDLGERAAIKLAANGFTTPERIAGWRLLADAYNARGVYMPRVLIGLDGEICSECVCEGVRYIVYAEEMRRLKTLEELETPPERAVFRDEALHVAALATRFDLSLPAWPSAWCMYELFDPADAHDENYENAEEICQSTIQRFPALAPQAERVWRRFLQQREELYPVYRCLPQSFFQGDVNDSNLLFDDAGHVAGLMDLNLAGREVNLNYLYGETTHAAFWRAEIRLLDDPAFLGRLDDEMRRRMACIERHYTFSSEERAAFPLYYRVARPFESWLVELYTETAKTGAAASMRKLLDWMEAQQLRDVMLP